MSLSALFHRLRRASNLPAVIAAIVAVLLCFIADNQNRQLTIARARSETMSQLSLIQDRLEGDIRGEIQLARGLAADIAAEPDIDQDRFDRLCAQLMRNDTLLHNIAVAPGLVVAFECPREGNEAAIGLDYRKNDKQREAALRARDSGEAVLAGPVELVQGGRAFIARLPVFVDGADETQRFWGLVAAVIDLNALYRDAGLIDSEFADRRRDLRSRRAGGRRRSLLRRRGHRGAPPGDHDGARAGRRVAARRRPQGRLERGPRRSLADAADDPVRRPDDRRAGLARRSPGR